MQRVNRFAALVWYLIGLVGKTVSVDDYMKVVEKTVTGKEMYLGSPDRFYRKYGKRISQQAILSDCSTGISPPLVNIQRKNI
jgi:hypothetical protein